MPKCPSCKQMRPKESFRTPGGYRCIKCTDCRGALREKRKAQRAERPDSEAALRHRAEEVARKPAETSKPGKLPLGKHRAVVRTCAFCGVQFERPNRRRQDYCSAACRLEAAKARMKAAGPKPPTPKTLRNCVECGKLFRPVNANQLTCCKECKASRFKRVRRGEVRQPRQFALSFDPYEDNQNWAGVTMNSTSFNPLG
jgi:hypothetical protein